MFYIAAFRDWTDASPFAQLFTDDPAALERFARKYDAPGVSIYECVATLKPGSRKRCLETVASIRFIHSDIDQRGLVTSQDTVFATLQRLHQELPFEIRDSGGGYHIVPHLKEPAEVDTPYYDRAVAARTAMTELLCADLGGPNHSAALLRRLGTHNSKWGVTRECRIIVPGKPIDITELEAFLERHPRPLFKRKPKKDKKSNDHDTVSGDTSEARYNREDHLAELHYPGNIHDYELRCTASLISSGIDLDDAVNTVFDDIKAYIDTHPPQRPWNWDKEKRRITRMSYSWVNKHPELAPTLPADLLIEYNKILQVDGNPVLHWSREQRKWWVKSKIPISSETAAHTKTSGWQYYDTATPEPMRWTIKGILIELGVTILSGQWGTFKTTVALYLALSVMAKIPFAGRFRVKRSGGVIYFAAEGNGGIDYRLKAIADAAGVNGRLPFAHRADCPPLKNPKSVALINAMVDEAAAELKRTHGVDTATIMFDTWAKTSGADNKGEDDDAGVSTAVTKTLEAVGTHAKCGTVIIDHMGKNVEQGTRGSSGKEAVEGLLATLGDRKVAEPITNTRLIVRKVKDGAAGFEVPFTPNKVDIGVDEDGDPITAIVLDWGQPRDCPIKVPRTGAAIDLILKCLDDAIATDSIDLDRKGGSVRAVPLQKVRERFYAEFVAKKKKGEEPTPEEAEDIKRRAFNRVISNRNLPIGMRTADGITWLWRVPDKRGGK
jgi:hypothetical protein